jgi:hypothetical protein
LLPRLPVRATWCSEDEAPRPLAAKEGYSCYHRWLPQLPK